MILHLGNNKDVLKSFEDNSIDSIVTDPPYELGFMGKSWDSSGIAYDVELWSELLRVLKPGGHLLAFSGTRTYHRMAVAIEDAGFEIRDMIEYIYGSGFPKSLNIGKAVDKLQGNEREEYEYEPFGREGRSYQCEHGSKRQKETVDGIEKTKLTKAINTKGTSKFEGWGTALKPAHEPICMARKPLEQKTVAENCLKWGTGGINIDESRVEHNEPEKHTNRTQFEDKTKDNNRMQGTFQNGTIASANPQGRFPANIIHDGSEEVMACFPESKSSDAVRKNNGKLDNKTFGKYNAVDSLGFADSGNASRFFKSIIYTSKPSKAERNLGCEPVFNLFEQSEGLEEKQYSTDGRDKEIENAYQRNKSTSKNFHPTVKPIELMEYLIKMVTPKGGIVLDPFMGSGSTGCGAVKNGFDFIGIDLTPEYLEIAEKRIKRYKQL